MEVKMSQRLEREIEAVQMQFIRQGKQFTALDVGNELKANGVNARQKDISPIVRKHFHTLPMYVSSGYARVLVPVENGAEAFLYTRVDQSPEDYTETNKRTLPWQPEKGAFKDSFAASKKSRVYHAQDCPHKANIKPTNLVFFDDKLDAVSACYRACKNK
jgi:hypothetical protein